MKLSKAKRREIYLRAAETCSSMKIDKVIRRSAGISKKVGYDESRNKINEAYPEISLLNQLHKDSTVDLPYATYEAVKITALLLCAEMCNP